MTVRDFYLNPLEASAREALDEGRGELLTIQPDLVIAMIEEIRDLREQVVDMTDDARESWLEGYTEGYYEGIEEGYSRGEADNQ